MTMMPPISSTTARAAKNMRRLFGTREPSAVSTARAKAISVAIGIAAPMDWGCWLAMARKNSTGTTIPPKAAMIGSKAFLGEDSSPTSSSCLISSPTRKKKMAIKASLTTWLTVIVCPACLKISTSPTAIWTGWFRKALYASFQGELAMSIAAIVAMKSRTVGLGRSA